MAVPGCRVLLVLVIGTITHRLYASDMHTVSHCHRFDSGSQATLPAIYCCQWPVFAYSGRARVPAAKLAIVCLVKELANYRLLLANQFTNHPRRILVNT